MKHRTKKPRFPIDVPIADRVAQAIGHAVVEWGRFEDLAGVMAACLMGTSHYDFRSVAANMMGRGKFETLSAVAVLKMPPRKAATLKKIAEAAKGLEAERNRIVHGCWLPTGKPHTAQRYSYRAYGEFVQKKENVSAKRIDGHTAEVVKLARRLNYALERQGFWRSLNSSQETPPPEA